MVYRKIDVGVKKRALELLQAGWELQEVTTALGVHEKSIARWEDKFEDTGSFVDPMHSQGRPRIIGPEITAELQELVREIPSMYLDEIALWLAVFHDLPVSITTIHNTLVSMGLTYKNLIKPAAERNEDDRAAWRHTTRLHYTAAQMVFVDESSIDRRDLRRDRGRGLRGLRAAQKFRQARGQRFSLLPALSLNGYLVVRVVPGSVDGFEFYDFLVNDLLPIMNPYPQPCSVLVLDNCNIHKSAAVREAVDAAGCALRFLPTYSPDLNPIEESFSAVKSWLARNGDRLARDEFAEQAIEEACAAVITAEKAAGWFAHSGY